MNIKFEKAKLKDKDIIFSWLAEPHALEFWDTSQDHKNDILNFMNGRTEPSNYCDGLYTYWIGTIDGEPYSLIMTLQEKSEYNIPKIKKEKLSKTGNTYSMDYMIGNSKYFGQGLGAITLEKFIAFFNHDYDPKADTFFIDPDVTNPRAKHVYEKAGFEYVGDFTMEGDGMFKGKKTHFLIKKIRC